MTSTYTTNLGIEKIATGDQSGTWGDTTNTNFDILDQAVNGILALTLSSAGSSGSPTDIPITDGAAYLTAETSLLSLQMAAILVVQRMSG